MLESKEDDNGVLQTCRQGQGDDQRKSSPFPMRRVHNRKCRSTSLPLLSGGNGEKGIQFKSGVGKEIAQRGGTGPELKKRRIKRLRDAEKIELLQRKKGKRIDNARQGPGSGRVRFKAYWRRER